jgi:hypothetical protein
MMKKWMYLVIGCLVITLVGYSVMAYANGTSSSSSKEVQGKLISLEGDSGLKLDTTSGVQTIPLAKSVWVYRNQQKAALSDLLPGDQLELVLNTKMQAAYVKASTQAQGQTPIATPSPSPAIQAQPAPTESAIPTASPAPTPTAAPQTEVSTKVQPESTASTPTQWDQLSIDAKGDGVNLHMDENKSGAGLQSKVNIHTKNQGNVNLQGDAADQFIAQILAKVDLREGTSKEQLTQALIRELELDGSDLKLNMDIKWKTNESSKQEKKAKQQDGHADNKQEDDHGKHSNKSKDD